MSVVITSSGPSAAGATITLECSFSGTNDNDSTNFQWFKGPSNNRSQLTSDDLLTIHSNSSISQLNISSLRASHAGIYTCQATVGSVVDEGAEIVNINRKYWVHLPCFLTHHTVYNIFSPSVPSPVSVTVIPPTGAIIAGSSQNFTCSVELSPVVDVQVTVSTVWTGPAGFTTTNIAQPIMGSTTNYTATVLIDAARNGNYTCQASVSPSLLFTSESDGTLSEMATLSVGKLILQSVESTLGTGMP